MAEWSIPLDKFFDEAIDGANQQYRAIALELKSRTELMTPVDTGYLRLGWNLSVDIPSNATPITVDSAFDKGESALQSVTINSVIYLQNNVEYGPFVNNGTERMAGRFFVEGAIASLQG